METERAAPMVNDMRSDAGGDGVRSERYYGENERTRTMRWSGEHSEIIRDSGGRT